MGFNIICCFKKKKNPYISQKPKILGTDFSLHLPTSSRSFGDGRNKAQLSGLL